MMPWYDNPKWPRNEFGHAKRVYEMSPRELDIADAIVKSSAQHGKVSRVPVTQVVNVMGAFLVYVMGAGCVVGVL
jgi:hypothetical protein